MNATLAWEQHQPMVMKYVHLARSKVRGDVFSDGYTYLVEQCRQDTLNATLLSFRMAGIVKDRTFVRKNRLVYGGLFGQEDADGRVPLEEPPAPADNLGRDEALGLVSALVRQGAPKQQLRRAVAVVVDFLPQDVTPAEQDRAVDKALEKSKYRRRPTTRRREQAKGS